MLYYVALVLELVIRLNVTIVMKDAGDMKLSFIEYIPDILIRIEDVIVWQSFFILKKKLNSCILGRSFETVTCMAR